MPRALLAATVLVATVVALCPPAAAAADPTAGLTVRQLVGQRVVYAWPGTRIPAALRARIGRGEVAGVIVFARNVPSRAALAATLADLQSIRRPAALRAPLLVMIDQEGGLVKRVSGAPSRSAAEMGRGGAAVARAEGAATARNLRSLGVNVNLAPVVDVGRPGSYQRRIGRTFGSTPARVSLLATAFAAGLQEGGVAATLKHFPGLGAVALDQDATVQRITLPLATLRSVDEAPFAAGIQAGVRLVMTSSGIYPALSSRPAELSPLIATGELRGRLGFRGVSVTDDLMTPGMSRFGSVPSLSLAAARAGNDLLLYGGDPAAATRAYESLVQAAASGRLDRGALRTSARRVLALRASL